MKKKNYQRLLPNIRIVCLVVTMMICSITVFSVSYELPEENLLMSDALVYVGMLLTALLLVPMADVGQLLAGLCCGWKVQSYEALMHTIRRDADGKLETVRGCRRTRFMGSVTLIPGAYEEMKPWHAALVVLGNTLFALVWMLVFAVLTVLKLGEPVSLVLCELALGGMILLLYQLLPLGRRYTRASVVTAWALAHQERERRIYWGHLLLLDQQMLAKPLTETVLSDCFPCPDEVKTPFDATAVLNYAIQAMQQKDYATSLVLVHRVVDSDVHLSESNWEMLLHVGTLCELLCDQPSECTRLYQGKEGKTARLNMFVTPMAAAAFYAVQRLQGGNETETQMIRKRIGPFLNRDRHMADIFCQIDALAARKKNARPVEKDETEE